MSHYDFAIVGGGIVGLATAMEISHRYPDKKIVLIEKEKELAMHQTGHNSGVIHSGIYYKPGSMKAKTCVEGVKLIKQFCKDNHVPMKETGKVIVALYEKELPRLENLVKRAQENGIPGVEVISAEVMKEKEPYLQGLKGLWIPGTAIVSYTDVCAKFAEIIRGRGGEIRMEEQVKHIDVKEQELTVTTNKSKITSQFLINCAGLFSDKVARMAGVDPGVKIVPFRGEYYKLKEDKEFYVNGLIYPVPDPDLPFLGVHFTRMIHGGVEVGPNAVLAFKREGYNKTSFSLCDTMESVFYPGFWKMAFKFWNVGMNEMYRSTFRSAFLKDARKMIPDIKNSDVDPYKAGVRAQALDPSGKLVDDFWVKSAHRMVHVVNAPSPAATASLAIAKQIVDMVKV